MKSLVASCRFASPIIDLATMLASTPIFPQPILGNAEEIEGEVTFERNATSKGVTETSELVFRCLVHRRANECAKR